MLPSLARTRCHYEWEQLTFLSWGGMWPIKETWGTSTAFTLFCASHIPASKIHLLCWNLSPQCHRMWRLWKTIRSRDEALIVGICALIDPTQSSRPPPCEGTEQVSVTGKLVLPSLLASTAVSRDAFGGEPISVLCYGGSNGQRPFALTSVAKRPAQAMQILATTPRARDNGDGEHTLLASAGLGLRWVGTIFVGLVVSCKSKRSYSTLEATTMAMVSSTQKGNCSFKKGLCSTLRGSADSTVCVVVYLVRLRFSSLFLRRSTTCSLERRALSARLHLRHHADEGCGPLGD